MASTTRNYIKRKWRQADGNLETAQHHLMAVFKLYNDANSQLGREAVAVAMELIQTCRDEIGKLWPRL